MTIQVRDYQGEDIDVGTTVREGSSTGVVSGVTATKVTVQFPNRPDEDFDVYEAGDNDYICDELTVAWR